MDLLGLVLFPRDPPPDPTNPSADPNVGSARGNTGDTTSEVVGSLGGNTSTSLTALVSTLVPGLIIAAFWFALFLICRRTQHRWYAPRTHLPGLHTQYIHPFLSVCPLF